MPWVLQVKLGRTQVRQTQGAYFKKGLGTMHDLFYSVKFGAKCTIPPNTTRGEMEIGQTKNSNT
jgi:hypothetical protein